MAKLLLCLLNLAGILLFTQLSDGKVMMEYIGATGVPIALDSVPVSDGIDFHFILSFAIDASPSGKPQNGQFAPYWEPTLTPESVSEIKAQYPGVKVIASLSGWSIGDKLLRWYNPVDPDSWISNAFMYLATLVDDYHLDGIDIDYENFPRGNTTFAYCIGQLISLLKTQRYISVATIAPFYKTVGPYMELYKAYGDLIDFVNYQFYTDKIRSPSGYLETFRVRAAQFDKEKILPSYEVDGRGIQGDSFFDTLRLLEENEYNVNGVMIFSADASKKNNFYYERKSQDFLLNSTIM